jgi:hypothetical protein
LLRYFAKLRIRIVVILPARLIIRPRAAECPEADYQAIAELAGSFSMRVRLFTLDARCIATRVAASRTLSALLREGLHMTGEKQEKVLQQDFTLYGWVHSIPMTDDVYLGMQAQNIAIIDMTMLRPLEEMALNEFFSDADRVSAPTLSKLSALSQMWVFALYEYLRTWRQRARTLIRFEDELAKRRTDEERAAYMNEITDGIKAKARLVKLAPVFYLDHVGKVGDKEFMNTIRKYKEETEPLFREVEAIRMPLAKHEIAGNEKLLAEAPGFGGVSKLTGSMYWQIPLSENEVTIIERRTLADKFLNMSWFEEEEAALLLAEKQEVRTTNKRRRRRRRPRKKAAAAVEMSEATATEPLDEFIRTDKETTHDQQPANGVSPRRRGRRGGIRNKRKKQRAAEESRPEPVIAPKGEWPWKDSLMVVPPEPRPLRRAPRKPKK